MCACAGAMMYEIVGHGKVLCFGMRRQVACEMLIFKCLYSVPTLSKKVVHLSRWTSFFGWTGPIEMDRSILPFRPILNPRSSLFGIFHVQNGGKYLSLHFYGLLTADLSVLVSYINVQLQQVCSCFASKVYVLAVDGSKRRFTSRKNLQCSFCYSIRRLRAFERGV